MESATFRDKLHEYINKADERKLSALYVLVEDEIEQKYVYDDDTIAQLQQRMNNHLEGKSKSYTVVESFEIIRGQKK